MAQQLRGDAPPQVSSRAPLARSGRGDVFTDYVSVASALPRTAFELYVDTYRYIVWLRYAKSVYVIDRYMSIYISIPWQHYASVLYLPTDVDL